VLVPYIYDMPGSRVAAPPSPALAGWHGQSSRVPCAPLPSPAPLEVCAKMVAGPISTYRNSYRYRRKSKRESQSEKFQRECRICHVDVPARSRAISDTILRLIEISAAPQARTQRASRPGPVDVRSAIAGSRVRLPRSIRTLARLAVTGHSRSQEINHEPSSRVAGVDARPRESCP
jgi:hypothetical protein